MGRGKKMDAGKEMDVEGVLNTPPEEEMSHMFKTCPLSHHYQPEVDWMSMSNMELASSKLIFKKEFAELMFNQRVLHVALDPETLLLERFKFLCIVSSNLDEVYAKRLGNIPKFDEEDEEDRSKNFKKLIRPKTPFEEELAEAVRSTVNTAYECLQGDLLPKLKELGVEVISRKKLTAGQRKAMTVFFKRKILPILTPLSVDQTHPFPLLQSHGIYLIVVLLNPESGRIRRIYLRVPTVKPRAVPVDEDMLKYIPVEEIVLDNIQLICEGMEMMKAYPFRVTRNVKLVIDDTYFGESDNLLDFVWEEVHRRRSAPATRLEIPDDLPKDLRDMLVKELILDDTDVFVLPSHLVGLADFMSITFCAPFPEYRDPPRSPKIPRQFEGLEEKLQTEPSKIFNKIYKQDILVEYPKHSFEHSSLLFLRAAARDPKVRVIKCCLYRGGVDSPLVTSLIRAAKSGKEVSVLVELKASFDEVQNSEYARKLKRSGCNVSYGMLGLKAHCKLILVVREEENGLRPFANIATGNFNPGTAKLYTDQSLFTCREDICSDVIDLYNALFGFSRKRNYRRLLVAPVNMLSGFIGLIRKEASNAREGKKARIVVQVNGLTEAAIVAELYAASQAGVEIELIIRGICSLRPGLEGKSENIRVYSWIGDVLQHQRIFYFYDDGKEQIYIGSADWRNRNLNNRIEVCVPVDDAKLKKTLVERLTFFLKDVKNTWWMASDGRYYFRKKAPSLKKQLVDLEESEILTEEEYAQREVPIDPDEAEEDNRRYQVTIDSVPIAVSSVMHLCVPIQVTEDNDLRVLLVKPKDQIVDDMKQEWSLPEASQDASEELVDTMKRVAEEEAGVSGEVIDYLGWSLISDNVAADVHLFRVDKEEEWAEELNRERKWMTLSEALLDATTNKNNVSGVLKSVRSWFNSKKAIIKEPSSATVTTATVVQESDDDGASKGNTEVTVP